jgi:hypothetical protein
MQPMDRREVWGTWLGQLWQGSLGQASLTSSAWKPWDVFPPWKTVTLIDGTPNTQPTIMRRRIDGRWHYRTMTDDEHDDYCRRVAW